MQIEIVRHHRRPNNTDRDVEHFGISYELRRWRETKDYLAPIGVRERNLNRKTGGDDAEQSHHEGFDPAEAQMLHSENEKHVKRRDDHTDLQRNPE